MAKRAKELEEQAVRLSAEVFAAIPQMYLDKPDPSDGICRAWTDAAEAAMRASLVVEHLAGLLRAKAKITEPGPAAELEAELRGAAELMGADEAKA